MPDLKTLIMNLEDVRDHIRPKVIIDNDIIRLQNIIIELKTLEAQTDKGGQAETHSYSEAAPQAGAVADIGKTFIINTDEGKLALSQQDILNTIDADLDMMDDGDLMTWEVMRKDMTEKEIDNLPVI